MKKCSVLIFAILVGATNLLAQAEIDAKEYPVYSAVLKVIYKENRETYSGKSEFVFINRTKTDPELDLPKARRDRNLVMDFVRKNRSAGRIERKFPRGAYAETYQIITQSKIDDINEKARLDYEKRYAVEKLDPRNAQPGGSSWTMFYREFPDASGYYYLSRVGFHAQSAMVQVTGDLGWNGFSRTYILKKVKGKWRIISFSGKESIS